MKTPLLDLYDILKSDLILPQEYASAFEGEGFLTQLRDVIAREPEQDACDLDDLELLNLLQCDQAKEIISQKQKVFRVFDSKEGREAADNLLDAEIEMQQPLNHKLYRAVLQRAEQSIAKHIKQQVESLIEDLDDVLVLSFNPANNLISEVDSLSTFQQELVRGSEVAETKGEKILHLPDEAMLHIYMRKISEVEIDKVQLKLEYLVCDEPAVFKQLYVDGELLAENCSEHTFPMTARSKAIHLKLRTEQKDLDIVFYPEPQQ